MPTLFTRRGFAGTAAAALGAALLEPAARRADAASAPAPTRRGPIALNANENPYGASDAARRAIVDSIAEGNRYPDAAAEATRRAIAEHHGVSPHQIALGCGSSQILQMADAAWLGSGKRVVAAEPTFEAVLAYAAVMHAEPVKVPETADFRHDLAAMAAACRDGAGLVYVCNPNNPTGTIVSAAELADFCGRVPAATAILVDEAYSHFVEDASYRSAIELLPKRANLVVARTFSKIYGLAGMRLGYAVASPETARGLELFASWDNVNAAVLAAARASLADADFVSRRRRELNDTRRKLCDDLAREGRRFIPSHANFVMIDVGRDVAPVIADFRARGILVGRKFPSMPNWLRISIGMPDEMRAFADGLREIVPAAKAA